MHESEVILRNVICERGGGGALWLIFVGRVDLIGVSRRVDIVVWRNGDYSGSSLNLLWKIVDGGCTRATSGAIKRLFGKYECCEEKILVMLLALPMIQKFMRNLLANYGI